jgi:hypothetical protein
MSLLAMAALNTWTATIFVPTTSMPWLPDQPW